MTPHRQVRQTRPISWIKTARAGFAAFPAGARRGALETLTAVADGAVPDNVRLLAEIGPGVGVLTVGEPGDLWSLVYSAQINADVWVLQTGRGAPDTPILQLAEAVR